MAEYLKWDETGKKLYETGTKKVVLYLQDSDGTYSKGYAWSGVTSIAENPSGADPTDLWADDVKYLTMRSTEEFGFSINAYMYPDEFGLCDGSVEPEPGIRLYAQTRKTFGLCYRTAIGNDIEYTDYGYKLHLIYGATCSPSGRDFATMNDSPEAIEFSWECTCIAPSVSGYKPTAIITIDSTKVDKDKLATLEAILYGTAAESGDEEKAAIMPRLPLPDEVIEIFKSAA